MPSRTDPVPLPGQARNSRKQAHILIGTISAQRIAMLPIDSIKISCGGGGVESGGQKAGIQGWQKRRKSINKIQSTLEAITSSVTVGYLDRTDRAISKSNRCNFISCQFYLTGPIASCNCLPSVCNRIDWKITPRHKISNHAQIGTAISIFTRLISR